MANNRMFLVNRQTMEYVLLAKHWGQKWDTSNFDPDKLADFLNSLETNDQVFICVENRENGPLGALIDWNYRYDEDGKLSGISIYNSDDNVKKGLQ